MRLGSDSVRGSGGRVEETCPPKSVRDSADRCQGPPLRLRLRRCRGAARRASAHGRWRRGGRVRHAGAAAGAAGLSPGAPTRPPARARALVRACRCSCRGTPRGARRSCGGRRSGACVALWAARGTWPSSSCAALQSVLHYSVAARLVHSTCGRSTGQFESFHSADHTWRNIARQLGVSLL